MNSRLFAAAITLAAVSSVLLSAPAQAQTLISDNFEAEGASLNYNSFINWNVVEGSVDLLGFYNGFGRSIDMDGSTGNAGTLVTKTTFNLDPGDYTLSFAIGKNGSGAESMAVSVGSVFNTVVSDAGGAYPVPLTQTFNFTLANAATGAITFNHAGADNGGYVLDNVSLVRANAAVAAPEPSALALLLPALPLAGMVLRRRKPQV